MVITVCSEYQKQIPSGEVQLAHLRESLMKSGINFRKLSVLRSAFDDEGTGNICLMIELYIGVSGSMRGYYQ